MSSFCRFFPFKWAARVALLNGAKELGLRRPSVGSLVVGSHDSPGLYLQAWGYKPTSGTYQKLGLGRSVEK